MTNLAIHTENKTAKTPGYTADWSPLRMMRDYLNWDPFRAMEPFSLTEERVFLPRFEIFENKDGYVFKADMPGLKEADLNLSLTGNRLVISGRRESRQEQVGTTYYVFERPYGDFSRCFTLPDGADTDHMTAHLTDGVLTLIIPKKPGAQTKQIPVTGGVGVKS
jgi:HSP20 family protein